MTIKTQAYLQGYLHEKTAMIPSDIGHDPRPQSPRPTRNPKLRAYEDFLLALKRGEYGSFPSPRLPGQVLKFYGGIEQWAKENPQYYRGGPEYQGGFLEPKKLWKKAPIGGWSDSDIDSMEGYA